MSRRVSFSLDGTWKRVRISADYADKTVDAGGGFTGNIIYPVKYNIVYTVIYAITRSRRS